LSSRKLKHEPSLERFEQSGVQAAARPQKSSPKTAHRPSGVPLPTRLMHFGTHALTLPQASAAKLRHAPSPPVLPLFERSAHFGSQAAALP
jgi:hypothetical protein